TEGLVLQDEKVWKLEQLYPAVKYVNRLAAYNWGQKMMRFYDQDGNLIEVRTPT
ncbi:MAG: glyoxalase/bleomycin resistance/dioxygenase family protein, partial [Lachnospiraceae bacterium]|nr:glyoxalase/bleomycin resistance/dioxygenase family protein [Lachnospiraceae bacterium]